MAATNTFDKDLVVNALRGRLGFLNPTKSGYDIVDTDNDNSSSGRYFNDGSFHHAVTVENIKECQEDANLDDTELNAHLVRLKESNILSIVNDLVPKQCVTTANLFDRQPNTPLQTLANSGLFVGYRLTVPKGYAVKVDKLVLLLNGVQTFKIYLFAQGKSTAIASKNVTTTANEYTLVDSVTEFSMRYDSLMNGTYYIGYFQSELGSAQALDISEWYRNNIPCVGWQAVSINPATATTITNSGYTETSYNFGLNMQLSVYPDYTDTIISQAHLLDELQGLGMAVKVLEQVKYSQRTNGSERRIAENMADIATDLDTAFGTQEMPRMPGIKAKYNKELKKVKDALFFSSPINYVTA